jgi:hypothetical protein
MPLPIRNITMDMKAASVATIAGDAEVDHAIATLVLAFSTDPVARWMYDDPQQEQRSVPATALASRSGFHRVFTAMMGRLRRLLQKALLRRSKPMWAPHSRGRNITGQPRPIGTCRSSESKLCIGTRGVVRHYYSTVFANAIHAR